jgi:polyisoprenoid-binding protein YceI
MFMRYIVTALLLAVLAACEEAPKADKATITEAHPVKEAEGNTYKVDTANSELQWIGTKPTGKHTGSFHLQEGTLYVKNKKITGGVITINMSSLQRKLEIELKGPMFFEVEKYPTATFEITNVSDFKPPIDGELVMKDANYTIQGNLTIKNVTKNISFPAAVKIEHNEVSANASFNLDRTIWGMTYRADKSMQDKLINSLVNISFTLKAKH